MGNSGNVHSINNSRRRPSTRELTFISVTIIMVVFLGVKVYFDWRTTRPLDQFLRELEPCVAHADGGCLYSNLYEPEVRTLGLTPKKVSELMEWRKALIGLTYTRERAVVSGNETDDFATADFFLQSKSGIEAPVTIAAIREHAPSAVIVNGIVFGTLQVAYGSNEPHLTIRQRRWGAIAKGIRMQRSNLEAIGLKGYYEVPPAGDFVSWQELQDMADRNFARALADGR